MLKIGFGSGDIIYDTGPVVSEEKTVTDTADGAERVVQKYMLS